MARLTKDERHQKILAELSADSARRLTDLAQDLGVSRETIRRDLDELDSNGIISRTYGGAIVRPRGFESNLKSPPTVTRFGTIYKPEITKLNFPPCPNH